MLTQRRTPSNTREREAGDTTRSVVAETFHALARVSLVLVLIVAPWFFGGVQTHVQYALYFGVIISLAFWILGAVWGWLSADIKANRLPLSFVPILAGLVLGAYQLRETRPHASTEDPSAISTAKLDDPTEQQELTKTTLIQSLQADRTISPAVTRFVEEKLLFAIATFLLGVELFATRLAQLWLWRVFAANGSALAFFGIAQQLSWNGRLFWTVTLRHGGMPFSSFVNRNNAAGYLCICLGAALGFLISTLPRRSQSPRQEYPRSATRRNGFEHMQSQVARFFQSVAQLKAIQLAAGTCVILIATAIVSTVSRGGWLALASATMVTSLIASRTRGLSVVVFVAAGMLVSIGLIASTGLENRISERWNSTASADAIAGDGRWLHWSDSINVVRDFPLTGTGLGTYQFAYLPYQSQAKNAEFRFYHADNQFLEWFVESGVIGIALIAITCLLFALAVNALLKTSDLQDPVGLVGVFVLVSQCVSGFFDFGPSMPANMLALAVVFGAITGRATLLATQNEIVSGRWLLTIPVLRASMIVPVLGIPLLIGGAYGLRDVQAASAAHSICQQLPKLDSPDDLDDASVDDVISRLTAAISNYSDDPDSHQALANLWIYKFRMEQVGLALKDYPEASAADVWPLTHLSILYRQANAWRNTGQFERLEIAIEAPSIQACLAPAFEQLVKTQACCALEPDIDQNLALLKFINDPQHCSGEDHLKHALLLAPANPQEFYEVGVLAHSAELTDFAYSCFRRSLELSPRFLLSIHKIVSETLSLDEELDLVLPDTAEVLIELAGVFPPKEERAKRRMLANRALKLLLVPREGLAEGNRRYSLARAKLLLGEQEEAIEEYRQALTLVKNKIHWRLELIRLIDESKGILWALREVEIGLAITPEDKQLQGLVRELRLKAGSPPNLQISSPKGRN